MANEVENKRKRQAKRKGESHVGTAVRQRQKSKHGRVRRPNVAQLYSGGKLPYNLGSEDYRLLVYRPDVRTSWPTRIDGVVETVNWREEPGNPVMQGELHLQKPDLGTGLTIHDGHVLRLDCLWGGNWREVWRLRLYDGEKTPGGLWGFQLADDGRLLQESEDDWHYTKSKAGGKPNGWLCHEILVDVARRYRVPLGTVAQGTKYITDLDLKGASPMRVLQRAYAIERRATGRRFVIRWTHGKLNILPLTRNPLLFTFADTIEDAIVRKAERGDQFATALTVRATAKKPGSRKRQKIVHQLVNEGAVRREGFVHKQLKPDDVKDLADAIKKGKRYMQEHSVRAVQLENLQHRLVPFVRRGDAIRVQVDGFQFRDKKGALTQGICYVGATNCSLSGGDGTMSLDVTLTDPYKPTKEDRKKQDKAKRTTKRNQKITRGALV